MEYLKQKGLITHEQEAQAVSVQQQTGAKDIGKVLMELKLVAKDLLQAKAQESGTPFVDLDRVQIESSAINVVPERIAKNHTCIPVKKDGTTIWLAMANTQNIEAQDDVRMVSGCRVIPVMAVPGAIEDAIKKYLQTQPRVTRAALPQHLRLHRKMPVLARLAELICDVMAEAGAGRVRKTKKLAIKKPRKWRSKLRSSNWPTPLFNRQFSIAHQTSTLSHKPAASVSDTELTVFWAKR